MKLLVLLLALALGACSNHYDSGSVENPQSLFTSMEKLAQRGNPEVQYHLGMMYNNGIGVNKNPQKAFEWFSQAAASGDPLGAYKLGCYFGGQCQGVVAIDPSKELEYKLIAAKAGYALAQHDVGIIYYKQGNFDEALKWWKKAAEQGYPMALYTVLSLIFHYIKFFNY